MPVYFLKITVAGNDHTPSQIDLPDIDAAWEEATITCSEMIKVMDGSFVTGTEWSIEIQDELKNVLRSLTVLAKRHRD